MIAKTYVKEIITYAFFKFSGFRCYMQIFNPFWGNFGYGTR